MRATDEKLRQVFLCDEVIQTNKENAEIRASGDGSRWEWKGVKKCLLFLMIHTSTEISKQRVAEV